MDKSLRGLLLNCESPAREPVDAVPSLPTRRRAGGVLGVSGSDCCGQAPPHATHLPKRFKATTPT